MEPDAPISGRSPRVQTFACRAAPVGLGSQLPFAACSSSGYYADKVDLSRRGFYLSRQASKIMHETSSIVPIDL